MKVAIIGYSGCGKSTLARRLGKWHHLPVLHVDRIHWLPGWKERPAAEEKEQMEHFLDSHDSWVIDGNYTNLSYERRMEEADQIIFLNFGRVSCFFRALRRYLHFRGRTRKSITEGCKEKMDREFIWWILYKGRTEKRREHYRKVLEQYAGKAVAVRNQKELDNLIKENYMISLFEQYKAWRKLAAGEPSDGDMDDGDRKAFMKYAKLKKLDRDDFEELELQYDEYLIELETE